MSVIPKIIAIILALVGLLMSSCGGIFTVASMGQGTQSMLVIALPSLAVGLLLIWIGVKLWKSSNPTPPAAD